MKEKERSHNQAMSGPDRERESQKTQLLLLTLKLVTRNKRLDNVRASL